MSVLSLFSIFPPAYYQTEPRENIHEKIKEGEKPQGPSHAVPKERDKVQGREREKNISLDAKRRKYLKGLVGTYQGKQGWSVREG